MILGHSIALDATAAQQAQFRRACGTARFAWNWGFARWKELHAAGAKPTAQKIKVQWNAHRKAELPWSYVVTRNDQFQIDGDRIRIPRVGWVKMHEPLRLVGKIMGARVARIGHRWHVSVQVETTPQIEPPPDATVGVDLGITTLMTLSRPLPDGRTEIANPKARRALIGRQRKIARRISRQELVRRRTGAKTSRRQMLRRDKLRRLHYRIASIRKDAMHKATTAVAKAFRVVVLEDLHVAGMARNKRLAGAVLDASFHEARRQLDYKTTMRGGRIVVVDRYFPSSKRCAECGTLLADLPLSKREWTCPGCGTIHDRDANAARNLELVGAASPEPAGHGARPTCGEIGALAGGQPPTKLRSMTRKSVLSSPK